MSGLSRSFSILLLIVACILPCVAAPASQSPPDGRTLFKDNCATCHGADGRGDRKISDVGFPYKMPDFHDCSFANREADGDWSSIIHRGGPRRAFPRTMPAFDQALSDEEIDAVIGYLRTFCGKSGWPRGEFNFPLALFTEKAFPEDEALNLTSFNAGGKRAITSTSIFEKRFGPRGQLEINLPFSSIDSGAGARSGIGDIGIAWKQNLLADVETGTIFSLLGEVVLPTGSAERGLGKGTFNFETHALFAQMLPDDFFLQGDVFGEFPAGKGLPKEAHVHLSLGKTFAGDEGFGRAWSPQVELLTWHEFAPGAQVDWDIVPQLQVSLSKRQHILASAGLRVPLNNTAERKPQFVFYILWDWYDAGLQEGWR